MAPSVLRRLFLPSTPASTPLRYSFAASCCAAAFMVRLMLDPLLRDRSPLLLFILAVAIVAIRAGFGPGLLATGFGAVGALFFFRPVGSFLPVAREYRAAAVFQLAIYFLAGVIISWLAGELRYLRWKTLEFANQPGGIPENTTDGFEALDRGWRSVYLNQAVARHIGDRKLAEPRLRETVTERDRALGDVPPFGGLLPICADCKKIRDEHGRWHQVETYISRHSRATFSHGLCPDCVQRYYAELVREIPGGIRHHLPLPPKYPAAPAPHAQPAPRESR